MDRRGGRWRRIVGTCCVDSRIGPCDFPLKIDLLAFATGEADALDHLGVDGRRALGDLGEDESVAARPG